MFNKKILKSLQIEIKELKDQLKLAEERHNSQYTDIMLSLKELTNTEESLCLDDENLYDDDENDEDELLDQVREFIIKKQQASTSLIQRKFKIGYGRAARMMDQLEEKGTIDSSDGTNKPRKVFIPELD